MPDAKRAARMLLDRVRTRFGRNLVTAEFAGHKISLDTRWRHERQYLAYIERSEIHGPLAMDVWVFSHFVRQGHTTLDAGANIGFTALLAERAGAAEVHCFEPDPRLVERLSANVAGQRIIVHPVALGEKPGVLTLRLSNEHNQGSTASDEIVSKFPDVYGKAEFVEVEVGTIDAIFGNRKFDFFKVDVEGSELATLKGASALLQRNRPETIYVEIYDEMFGALHDFLKLYYEFSYRILCDREGRGTLLPLGVDVSRYSNERYYVVPPSYIYSVARRDDLMNAWKAPDSRL